ncbi:LysR family transcriptional regulator [Lentzea sp. NPDC034063]|uniref:LysR substrate-binding domain-containing protein n=1 Tax=unclassified Lentzea TaxID=2643253 RepID=UPI0033F16DF7
MEMREMRAFVAAVEAGSLSAAARQLYVSQSALSQTIQGLERQLGVTLLLRSNTGIRMTEAGVVLLPEARAILSRHDQVVDMLTRRPDDEHLIRIGMPAELPPDLLSDALAGFAVRRPTVRFAIRQLSSSRQIAALRTGELDLGLVRERPPEDLDVELLVEEPMGVLLPLRLVSRYAGPDGIHLDSLAGLEWVGFPRSDCPAWHDEVATTLRRHGIYEAASDVSAPTDELKLAAVSVGDTFALAPALRHHSLPRAVSWLPLAGAPLIRRTWATWPAGSRCGDLATLVRQLCASGLRGNAVLDRTAVKIPDDTSAGAA